MWLAAVLFVAILGLLAFFDTRKPKKFPPGPRWLPIIGSAFAVYKLRKKTGYLYQVTSELARQYGPVFGLRVGVDKMVVVHSCEAIYKFLMEDDLSGRPHGIFYKTRTWGIRRGILLTDEEFWQEQRRFVLRHLRDFGFGKKNMSTMIEEEVSLMVQNIKQQIVHNNGAVLIQMDECFGIHVLNTLWMMMAGIRYSPDDKELKTLQSILKELFANIDMVGTLFSHFPILRFIAPEFSGYNMYVKTHSQILNFLKKEIKKHRITYDPNNLRDFMDVYLHILDSPLRKDSFSKDQLLAICMDLFIAGSETTNKSLGFGFLYMLLYPEVQKRAQEEIDRVVGRYKLPTLSDRPRMPYMEGVVLESVRMFTGRTFSIPHRALKDTELNGYIIPKDTMVIANFNGVLMGSESGWSDPEEFRPDRFIKDGRITTPESYLPFGFGKHRCMGETLAKANIFLIVSSILQNFDLTIPEGCQPPTGCLDGATPAPAPFKALITLRHS